MDVDGLAQVFRGHGAALDVPAGAPPAPGAVPRRLAGLLRLPQGKVQRVPLLLPDLDAGAGLQVVQSLLAQGAVLRPASDVEVDVAVRHVGMAVVHDPLNRGDDLRNVLRGAGGDGGRADAQRLRVLLVLRDETLRQLRDRRPLPVRPMDHLVVDVREVLNEGYLVPQVLQPSAQHVEDDEGPGVADVKVVVYRRPAAVEGNLSLLQRDERLLFARKIVVQHQAQVNSTSEK